VCNTKLTIKPNPLKNNLHCGDAEPIEPNTNKQRNIQHEPK